MRKAALAAIPIGLLVLELAVSLTSGTAFGVPSSYVVVSGSMVPVLKVGDVVLVQPIAYSNVKVGDIIIYYEPALNVDIVHRVVAVTPQGLITKGDANPRADEPYSWPAIQPSQVRGEVLLSVPYVGLFDMKTTPLDRYLIVAFAFLMVIVTAIPKKKP